MKLTTQPLVVLAIACLASLPALGQSPRNSTMEARPGVDVAKRPDLPAVPDRVLEIWAEKTGDITKMDGDIQRIEYEEVFKVEKHSKGRFYYERPDKGRLDLTGLKFPEGKKGGKFDLADGDSEEWICDGARIYQVHRELKEPQANVFPIPEDQQGQNIMNGPLPFLFGMPPKLARERYDLYLKDHDEKTARIIAFPKWPADAQNYSWAEIILAKKTYLPIAVKLRNPANSGDTVYMFRDIVLDRRFQIRDPFKAPKGVKLVNKLPADPRMAVGPAPLDPNRPLVMPSMVGMHGKAVVNLCKTLGVKPRFLRGKPADGEQFEYRVYKQDPVAKAPLVKGQEIKVTLYDKPGKG